MDNSIVSRRFWGLVFALTLLGSVGAVAKALGATEAVAEKPLQARSVENTPYETASAPSHPDEDLAGSAGRDFSTGASSLGNGFVKGAKVTGNAFKTAGTSMANGFKKAGRSIRDYFMGKNGDSVEENDLNYGASDNGNYQESARGPVSEELDAVGNDMPSRAEPKNLSKQAGHSEDSAKY